MQSRTNFIVDCFNKLSKYISILSDNRVFLSDSDKKKAISQTILESLPLFNFLSQKSNKNQEAKDLITKFRDTYNVPESSSSNPDSYENASDQKIIDEINYLKICVKNITNLDLDEPIPEDKPKVSDDTSTNSSFKNYDTVDSFKAYKALFMGPEDSSGLESVDPSGIIHDFHIRLKAHKMLDSDINDGKLYIYKEKPSLNIAIKRILIVLYGIGIALCLAFLGLLFRLGASKVNEHKTPVYLGISSLIYFIVAFGLMFKTFSNENFKYSFQKRTIMYSSLFLFPTLGLSIFGHGPVTISDPYSCAMLWAGIATNVFSWIVYFIGYVYFQPKRDEDLIKQKLDKYISDLSNSK